jgi:hypothetical protein
MSNLRSLGLAVLLFTAAVIPASSNTLSFAGNFANDNDVVLIPFALPTAAFVTFQTFGYGGGTNGAGNVILAGGFESILQLFDVPGGAVHGGSMLPGPDPTCGPRTPDPARLNFCFDVFAQMLLSPGDYILALTQNPNTTAGSTLAEGFIFDGDPNFAGGFFGTFSLPGDSHYAVDINVADVTVVPEPGAALLIAPALLLIGVLKRRRSISRAA